MSKMSLQLYRPVISNKLTQRFAENKACIYPNGKVVGKKGGVCPGSSKLFYPSIGMKGHSGLDFSTWHGEPVFHNATFPGFIRIEKDFDGGIGVDVISESPVEVTFWHGSRKEVYFGHVKCRYWHLKAPVGWDGKYVKLGEQIGLADNTGASSADHLHYGIKKCDKNGTASEPNNGYYGAFDPLPYMDLSVDAKSAAEYLRVPPPPLSDQERKEIASQLNAAQKLLMMLLELKRHL